MTGIAMARRWVALVVLGLGASLLAVLGPSAGPASAVTATVQWPSVSEVNPDATPYVVATDYAGTGSVWVVSTLDGPQRLEPGTNTVDFGSEDGYRLLRAVECPTEDYAADCPLISGRSVQVYRSLHLTWRGSSLGAATRPAIEMVPFEYWSEGTIAWEVRAQGGDGAPLLSRTDAFESPSILSPIGSNDVLVVGQTYEYHATVTAELPNYGTLTGVVDGTFQWRADAAVGMSIRDERLYPRRDWYLDGTRIRVAPTAPDTRLYQASLTVFDSEGSEVWSDSGSPSGTRDHWTGNWYPPAGQAPGTYTVELYAQAWSGHDVRRTATIEIGTQRAVTWKRTFKAVPTVYDVDAGKCGAVYRPARENWSGSVAYRAVDRCANYRGDFAYTYSAVRIPAVEREAYRRVSLSLYGGKARDWPQGWLTMALKSRGGGFVGSAYAREDLGNHAGPWLAGTKGVLGHWNSNERFVAWRAGLEGTTGYDVKTFTVKVEYWAFE